MEPNHDIENRSENVVEVKRRHTTSEYSIPKRVTSDRENQDISGTYARYGSAFCLDGLGGTSRGREAAQIGAEQLSDLLPSYENLNPDQLAQKLSQDLKIISGNIRKEVGGEGGTTIAFAKIVDTGRNKYELVAATVGDSRVYVYNAKGGELECISLDDDFAERYLENTYGSADHPRWIKERHALQTKHDRIKEESDLAQFESDEQEDVLRRMFDTGNMMSQSLGMNGDVNPHIIRRRRLQPGDIVLTLTDGVVGNLQLEEIKAQCAEGIDGLAQRIAEEAKRAGHKNDDITVSAAQVNVEQQSKQEYRIADGAMLRVPYDGLVQIKMPDTEPILVGSSKDLTNHIKYTAKGEAFVLLQPQHFSESNAQQGWFVLQKGVPVEVGNFKPNRMKLGETVSRKHITVTLEQEANGRDYTLVFQDGALNLASPHGEFRPSTNGSTIRIHSSK